MSRLSLKCDFVNTSTSFSLLILLHIMASSFIGYIVQVVMTFDTYITNRRKPISLISHSDIRYRGTLAGIDPHASTIQLENGS